MLLRSRESLVQVTVEHMEQGLSRDSYETFRAGYFDYDYAHAHDGTFLLDTQQRKWLEPRQCQLRYGNVQ